MGGVVSYLRLLGERQKEVSSVKKRYEVGLEKLATTEESVSGMQEELIALQPQLEVATKETEAAMEVIAAETIEADKVKEVVSKEEAIASEEAAKVKAVKDECDADLAEAMPMLEAALKALDTLTKNDITEVKGMKSPPAGVKLVMEGVCIMRGVKPVRAKDPNSGKMVDDYWEASKKLLMEPDFLQVGPPLAGPLNCGVSACEN
jgi:dynein heavy chain